MNCDYSPYSLPTIDFVGGSTQELVFHTFFSQNKKPFDLSSCTASFALINFVNKNGSPLIAKPMEVSKSEDGDGTVTNVLRVVLLPEETVDVKAKLFCPEIAGLFCRIAGLFCHDSRANLSLKPVCFGIAIS